MEEGTMLKLQPSKICHAWQNTCLKLRAHPFLQLLQTLLYLLCYLFVSQCLVTTQVYSILFSHDSMSPLNLLIMCSILQGIFVAILLLPFVTYLSLQIYCDCTWLGQALVILSYREGRYLHDLSWCLGVVRVISPYHSEVIPSCLALTYACIYPLHSWSNANLRHGLKMGLNF